MWGTGGGAPGSLAPIGGRGPIEGAPHLLPQRTVIAAAVATGGPTVYVLFPDKMLEFYTNINPGLMPDGGLQPPLTCSGRTG